MVSTVNKPKSKTGPDIAQADPWRVLVDAEPGEFTSTERFRALVLMSSDILSVLLSVALAVILSDLVRRAVGYPSLEEAALLWALKYIIVIPMLTILWFSFRWRHYIRVKPFWLETRSVAKMLVYAMALAGAVTYFAHTHFSRVLLVSSFSCMLLVVPSMRYVSKVLLARMGRWFIPLIMIGEQQGVRHSVAAIESDSTLGYRVAVRIVVPDLNALDHSQLERQLIPELLELARGYPQARLLLAFERQDNRYYQQRLAYAVSDHFRHIIISQPMHGLSAAGAELLLMDKQDRLFIRLASGGIGFWRGLLKRAIDITLSSLALVLLSPLMLLLTLLVRRDGGKAVYKSERIGLEGKRFDCYKFRSMAENSAEILEQHLESNAEARAEWLSTFKLRNDPRVTPLGRFMRKTSLDELPQLWNVLIGDMSLVGPRPIQQIELEEYGYRISNYQGVRPGVTGLWQVSGRSNLSYAQRVDLNHSYVRNWSLWQDFSILLRTLAIPFRTDDAY